MVTKEHHYGLMDWYGMMVFTMVSGTFLGSSGLLLLHGTVTHESIPVGMVP